MMIWISLKSQIQSVQLLNGLHLVLAVLNVARGFKHELDNTLIGVLARDADDVQILRC
jgi:hypothetical protein